MSRFAALRAERHERGEGADRPAVAAEEAVPELGNQAAQALFAGGLHAKLEVGGADDPEEREADALAEQVVAGPVGAPGAGGGPDSPPSGAGPPRLRRKAEAGASSPSAVAAGFGNRAGRPLDAGSRSHFERRFGTDLGGVRIHDDPATARVARGIGARAFAIGGNIGFAEGRHSPGTVAGQALLAHELAHVVLGHGGTRRQGHGGAGGAGGSDGGGGTSGGGGSGGAGPGHTPAPAAPAADPMRDAPVDAGPPSFHADDVDMATLTNERLNSESIRVDDWLRANGSGRDPDRPEYWSLARKLRTERVARVAAGHVWLATAGQTTPTRLFGLTPGTRPNIILVDLAKALGLPEAPGMMVMTEGQFHAYLASRNIRITDQAGYQAWVAAQQQGALASVDPTVGMRSPDGSVLPFGATGRTTPWGDENVIGAPAGQSAAVAMAASRGYNTPQDYFLSRQFAPAETNRWLGNQAEASYHGSRRTGFGVLTDPLNNRSWTDFTRVLLSGANPVHPATQQNYPIFDFQRLGGAPGARILGVQRVSVKTSRLNPAQRQAYYRTGMVEMMDVAPTAPHSFEHFLRNQPGQSGMARPSATTTPANNASYQAARTGILGDAYVAVNADDVVPFRAALSDAPAKWTDAQYARLYGAELRENPIVVDTPTGQQTLRSVADVDTVAGLTPAQRDAVRRQVGERVARRVVSSGITTEQVRALRSARQSVPATMTPADVAPWVTPEYISAARYGGGARGNALATGRASAQGAAGGSIIAVITTAGVMMIDEADHPNWAQELGVSGGMGAFGGAASTAIEQPLIAAGSRYALSAGAASWLRPGMVRYGAGGVAATVTAPIMEGISMGLLEDRAHSGEEIAGRSARAAGIGLTSYGVGVAATAATTGAIAVILGAGATGAAGGSVIPGWGTAIGFVVGLAAGAVSYYLLDQNLPGGRESWDAEARATERAAAQARAQEAAADAAQQRERAAERGILAQGTPYAAGVDDEAIPGGYGVRPSEQGPQMSLPP